MRYWVQVPNFLQMLGLPAGIVAVGFALLARIMGSVTDGGAVAGLLIAFVFVVGGGFTALVPLFTVFLLTVISTRWGYRRKQRLGVAEPRKGRKASQILANLGAAAVCIGAAASVPAYSEIMLIAAMAALAEAAADTVSSELGQATARRAYNITSFRDVPIGTNGAISMEGTISGCVAACIVAWVSAASGLVNWNWTPLVAFTGMAGMFLDSIIGATWENAGKLGNDSVNFISTVFAADVALIVSLLLQ